MRVKRFVGRTFPEVVSQVHAELGPQAVILYTRPVRMGGVFGLLRRKLVEAIAAVDDFPVPRETSPSDTVGGRVLSGASSVPEPATRAPAPTPAAAPPPPLPATKSGPVTFVPEALPPAKRDGLPRVEVKCDRGFVAYSKRWPDADGDLPAELAKLSSLMGRVLDHLDLSRIQGLEVAVRPVYISLVGQGVEPEIAAGLARQVQGRLRREGGRSLAELARAVLADHLGWPATVQLEPGAHRVIALVGPTGVGKTTTLAKLAAHFALTRERRVAVMTADTYRIAAVEQLRTYCELIGVPLTVAQSPEDVAAGLQAHRAADLILVDTAGRSHNNLAQMDDLVRYLAALRPDETYLVLSLTASTTDAEAVARAYEDVGYNRLLFTKLDEATQPGMMVNLRARTEKPLSYITTGQSVPHDIEVASPDRLLPLFLRELSNA
ncbi:flagellar biosynthesis protein FlhF [Caldinitratiruptor microaerophilus]|uniref:Flagellar biosynthesis protein FlhF n=1 Tax=Caldinitratiruptor microaerophilus TaxID=671077 RepID=A0AA35CJL0_9FIRM|nr:flagellar biosynthesis protein FlhF [Caldinitratiruptor microaerophilus]BDG60307.1 flagellar biosynthesis protein FlhF [Caldinitratiruptor microaerophilus]